ncbi:MAG TPA: radical SAM protein, partial [Pseudobdellovibrionaceae bacterium]|nr:radical SAM protein [Pseudobdellovibrionaceae bacterium]
PTFLSPASLNRLLEGIFAKIKPAQKDFEGAIEVDPRRTTLAQLEVFKKFGFNRISLGVQDFDPEVQRLVNRHQPYSITKNITDSARNLGFHSVNFDLIYGLARQTPESIQKTAELTAELRPDRIALYSFAMVPWIKPQQRLFKDEDLPIASEKRKLYEIARKVLVDRGYVEIGMDHFALADDGLAIAAKEKRLHRNFMGYTDQYTEVLLGLGVSAISETPESFHQNEKVFPVYRNRIESEGLATLRGHIHDSEDRIRRKQILELMTSYQVEFIDDDQRQSAQDFLSPMISDGLVMIDGHWLKVTDEGKPFLRNACVFFDERLRRQQPSTQVFSKSI